MQNFLHLKYNISSFIIYLFPPSTGIYTKAATQTIFKFRPLHLQLYRAQIQQVTIESLNCT